MRAVNNAQPPYAAIFLDRDGTITKDENPGARKLELVEGVAEAIKKLNKNFKTFIVTNQPDVAKGLYTEEYVRETNNALIEKLAEKGAVVDAVYYCPHHPEQGHKIPEWADGYRTECECRKPKSGMLLKASKDHNIDLKKSWMMGDQTRDIGAGKGAGCKTILLKTGYGGSDNTINEKPDFVAFNIGEAAEIILKNSNLITQALILAGGRGERLRPLTYDMPKPMLPVAGKPLLEWHMLNLKSHGVKDVIICASYKAEKIKNYFGFQWNGMKITYPEEPVPLGTGGAIKNASCLLDNNFLVINGDVANAVNYTSLSGFHMDKNALATLVVRLTEHPKDSDIVDVDEQGMVVGFIGKGQQAKNLGNTGIFAINKNLLSKIPDGFSTLEKDIIARNLDSNIFGYISKDYIKDVGTMERYQTVNKEFPAVLKSANLG